MCFNPFELFLQQVKIVFCFKQLKMQNMIPPPRLNFTCYFVSQNQSDQSLSIILKLYTQLEDTLN